RGAANDGIVHGHDHVLVVTYDAVGSIVYVLHQVLAVGVLRNEGPELCILNIEFLKAWRHTEYLIELLIRYFIGAVEQGILLQVAYILVDSLRHAKKGDFG